MLFQNRYLRFYHRNLEPLSDVLPLKGMCLPGVRRMYVDASGRILPCERVSERDLYCIGHVHDGGVDPAGCVELCRPMEDWFSKRCPDCIFCRLCTGCLSDFTDSKGEMSDAHLNHFCKQQYSDCANLLVTWAQALEENPSCFDYMESSGLK